MTRILFLLLLLFITPFAAFAGTLHRVVIMVDISESMKSTDPSGYSFIAAKKIKDQLELAGSGNGLVISFFGTDVYQQNKWEQTADYNQGENILNEGFNAPPQNYRFKSIEDSPPGYFTDIRRALIQGAEFLDNDTALAGTEKIEKHLVLLTDGTHDPFPGDASLFGKTAEEYKKLPEKKRKDKKTRKKFFERITRPFGKNGKRPLNTQMLDQIGDLYREKGYKIHTLAFSSGIDRTDKLFLENLSFKTGGNSGIKHSAEEIEAFVKEILPVKDKVVEIDSKAFCKTSLVKINFDVVEAVTNMNFVVSFSEMIKTRRLVSEKDFKEITITAPSGKTYKMSSASKKSNTFRFRHIKKTTGKYLLHILFTPGTIEKGKWAVQIESEKNICGQITVDAAINLLPVIDFSPPLSENRWEEGMELTALAYLNKPDGSASPLRKVTMALSSFSDDITTKKQILYDMKIASSKTEAKKTITLPDWGNTDIKMSFFYSVPGIHSEIRKEVTGRLVPSSQCNLETEPSGPHHLGQVSPFRKKSKALSLDLVLTGCQRRVSYLVKPPLLKNDESIFIPMENVHLDGETAGTIQFGEKKRFTVSLAFKEHIPPGIASGIYEGKLRFVAPKAVYRDTIIKTLIKKPEILFFDSVNKEVKSGADQVPPPLILDWTESGCLAREVSAELNMGLKGSLEPLPFSYTIAPALLLLGTEGETTDKIRLYLKGEGVTEENHEEGKIMIFPNPADQKIGAVLTYSGLDHNRVKPGTYSTTIKFESPSASPRFREIKVIVPVKPDKALFRYYSLTAAAGSLALFLLLFFLKKKNAWKYRGYKKVVKRPPGGGVVPLPGGGQAAWKKVDGVFVGTVTGRTSGDLEITPGRTSARIRNLRGDSPALLNSFLFIFFLSSFISGIYTILWWPCG